MRCHREIDKRSRLYLLALVLLDRLTLLVRDGEGHGSTRAGFFRMSNTADDVFLGGRLQLVASGSDILDLQPVKHDGSIAVVGDNQPYRQKIDFAVLDLENGVFFRRV